MREATLHPLITAVKINNSVQTGQPLTGTWYFQITHATVTVQANEHYTVSYRPQLVTSK
jgi:hypothetical protein